MQSVRTRARPRVFLVIALVALAAAAIGFFTTYTRPLWRAEFHGPPVAHVHGAFLLAWLLLFLAQSTLVQAGQVRRHRTFGWMALVVAPGVVASTVAMAAHAMHRDLAAGLGEMATSTLVGGLTSPLIFVALVAAALARRARPDVHKRLMLLATLVILWPAFFRFRHYAPGVPHPEWWFGFLPSQLLLLAAVLHDKLATGRVHPVYRVVGTLLVAEAALETWLFDSPAWRVLAHWLAGWFPA